jgi:hypothetical protein
MKSGYDVYIALENEAPCRALTPHAWEINQVTNHRLYHT